MKHCWTQAIETKGKPWRLVWTLRWSSIGFGTKCLFRNPYGLLKKLCEWITNFRSIKIRGERLDSMSVSVGVPQRCGLSSILFNVYIHDIFQINGIHCYADDSTGDALYTSRVNIS